ncbi:MAG: PilZ domain-containing protein, partial [Thermodesulfovibrionales bacterium]|nr:PilZ domain-containing protein [Thermodesulfovibrionales bacterium]
MANKEKRHFRRYKKRSMFNLLIGGKSFGAETVDYSADGVRLIIEDSPPIAEGTIIDLNIKEAAIHTTGEIVWLKKSKTHTRAGLKMTGPVKGSLKHHMLADILMGLQRSKLTGIFEIKSGP